MEKSTYETYEFLPVNSDAEPEPEQFFVVQDDGTFLLNRQVQYVAQVQDVKEVLEEVQPCTVYGVSSQQFFVDVDNSAELISVADQYILPDGENGLYTNSYLLQPSSSTTTELMEDVVVDQFKQSNTQDVDIDVVTHNSKQGNNFTEITLSDEQYQTLEQKGWILLESNDKIFVLNTLGLHDITTNDKLIQKLKNEIQNSANTGIDAGSFKIENIDNASQFPSNSTEPQINQQETVEFVNGTDGKNNECIENVQFVVNDKVNVSTSIHNKENLEIPEANQELPTESNILNTVKQATNNVTNSIKIKTKLNFKDIPGRIILGKTGNGKRLVAKVVKQQTNLKNKSDKYNKIQCNDDTVFMQISKNQHYNVTGLHEVDFVNLLQATLRAGIQTKFNEDDISSANTVITQLLKVPNLRQSLIGHNLIVTKVTNNKDEFGTIFNRSKVSLVTGRVTDEGDNSGFEHLPNLLQSIKSSSDKQSDSQSDETFSCIEEKETKENFTIFHVHITETTCSDNVVRVSVTLNKRQLPINLVFDLRKRYPTPVFACSACAVLFKSEETLKDHQENHCMDTSDMLTIDSDKLNQIVDDVITLKTGNETQFSCAQCDIQFPKLSDVYRHMKSHHGLARMNIVETVTMDEEADETMETIKTYKCKMCPSIYFYQSSLSKHIVTKHIKMKSK